MKKGKQEQQFLKFYDKYADAIFRHCYFRVFNRDKAKDLTQEAFMKLWKYMVNDKKIDYPQALLFKMANNLIIDFHRKKKESSLDKLQDGGFQPSDDPSDQLAINLDADAVVDTMGKLNDHHREVLLLRYVQGFKPKEIADMLGLTQNVISVRITRAKIQLRRILNKDKK